MDTTLICDEIKLNLSSNGESQRLFHGRGELFKDHQHINIDIFPPHLLITLYRPESQEALDRLMRDLVTLIPRLEGIIVQRRHKRGAPSEILWGTISENPIAQEEGLKFHLSLAAQQNIGFFLDMSLARKFLLENSKNKRVLNLFAFTGAFSIAAIAGGAESCVNFDMSRKSLTTARNNHRLNEHDTQKVQFFAHDILKSFNKIKKMAPFDIIVIDPPSDQGSSFKVDRDYQKIVRRLDTFLSDEGLVIACLLPLLVDKIQALQNEPLFAALP